MELGKIGPYAFIAGVLITIIASLIAIDVMILTSALVVLGIIIGLLNVSEKETSPFLMASVSLVIVSYMTGAGFSSVPVIGVQLQMILQNVMTLVTPAVIIVAIKQIYNVAKE